MPTADKPAGRIAEVCLKGDKIYYLYLEKQVKVFFHCLDGRVYFKKSEFLKGY